MKTYNGYRHYAPGLGESVVSERCSVLVRIEGGGEYALPPRQDIRNHSPAGFEWGYGGSGPAQLALALVADCAGKEFAVPKIYQRVKRFIAKLPRDGWTLTVNEVDQMIGDAIKETGFEPEVGQDYSQE